MRGVGLHASAVPRVRDRPDSRRPAKQTGRWSRCKCRQPQAAAPARREPLMRAFTLVPPVACGDSGRSGGRLLRHQEHRTRTEAERIPGGLNAYGRRALIPMRPATMRAKLPCPTTAAAPDVFDLDSAPGWLPAPSFPRHPRARPGTRSTPGSGSPYPRVKLPSRHVRSPHDPHLRRRRACR